MLAYKGATEIASASCIKGALNKLRYFKRGKNSFEEAVQDDPDNLEIRFLRYAVKINVPGFLNYNDYAVDEDFIIQNMDAYIQQSNFSEISMNIANFMVEHGKFSEEEKKYIRNLLNKK